MENMKNLFKGFDQLTPNEKLKDETIHKILAQPAVVKPYHTKAKKAIAACLAFVLVVPFKSRSNWRRRFKITHCRHFDKTGQHRRLNNLPIQSDNCRITDGESLERQSKL